MSTLTIKLSENEVAELDKLKISLKQKTSTGCIRLMIETHSANRREIDRLRDQLRSQGAKLERLKGSSQEYFNSMHRLMRECEFEQKL